LNIDQVVIDLGQLLKGWSKLRNLVLHVHADHNTFHKKLINLISYLVPQKYPMVPIEDDIHYFIKKNAPNITHFKITGRCFHRGIKGVLCCKRMEIKFWM
jgi:hypothetical protein